MSTNRHEEAVRDLEMRLPTIKDRMAKARAVLQTRRAICVALLSIASIMAQPSLRISAPPARTTFEPGQMVTVVVVANGSFRLVGLVGSAAAGGIIDNRESPPYEFRFRLRPDLSPGTYYLAAFGREKPQDLIYSPQIAIVVERREIPVRLQVEPTRLRLSPREVGVVTLVATYRDGTRVDVRESTLLSVRSDPPGIVSIINNAAISGISMGTARVTFTYRGLAAEVPVVVSKDE